MYEHFNESNRWMKNHCIGLGSSLASFCIIWPIDTTSTRLRFYNKRILSGGMRRTFYNYRDAISPNQTYSGMAPLMRSFLNVGFYWGFLYQISTGMLVLPLQKDLQHCFLQNTQIKNADDVIFFKALAGWCAALFQLVLLHPIDSIKVIAQKNPAVLKEGSLRYFVTQQPKLRRGTGVVALGSVTHFIAWYAKLWMEQFLQDKKQDAHFKTLICAFAFSLTHIVFAFPVNTVKTWAQGDTDFVARDKTFVGKTKRTMALTGNNVKASGFSAFYRGFASRGLMHGVSFTVSMTLFDMLSCVNDKILFEASGSESASARAV